MIDFASVSHRIETITPESAKQMLGRAVSSAKLDQASVQAFERDMREKRWALNGAPIVLSSDGQLLDGRARLNACARAGVPFDTLVIQGIDIAAFETIDSVRKRTLADVLSMRKEAHGRALGANQNSLDIWGGRNAGRRQAAHSNDSFGRTGGTSANTRQH